MDGELVKAKRARARSGLAGKDSEAQLSTAALTRKANPLPLSEKTFVIYGCSFPGESLESDLCGRLDSAPVDYIGNILDNGWLDWSTASFVSSNPSANALLQSRSTGAKRTAELYAFYYLVSSLLDATSSNLEQFCRNLVAGSYTRSYIESLATTAERIPSPLIDLLNSARKSFTIDELREKLESDNAFQDTFLNSAVVYFAHDESLFEDQLAFVIVVHNSALYKELFPSVDEPDPATTEPPREGLAEQATLDDIKAVTAEAHAISQALPFAFLKQREVATRLFHSIKSSLARSLDTFSNLQFIVCLPAFSSLQTQTQGRIRAAKLCNQPEEQLAYMWTSTSTKALNLFKASIQTNPDTLHVIIVDECHFAATNGGEYDKFVNDPAIRLLPNLVVLMVSATPYNALTRNARIPRDDRFLYDPAQPGCLWRRLDHPNLDSSPDSNREPVRENDRPVGSSLSGTLQPVPFTINWFADGEASADDQLDPAIYPNSPEDAIYIRIKDYVSTVRPGDGKAFKQWRVDDIKQWLERGGVPSSDSAGIASLFQANLSARSIDLESLFLDGCWRGFEAFMKHLLTEHSLIPPLWRSLSQTWWSQLSSRVRHDSELESMMTSCKASPRASEDSRVNVMIVDYVFHLLRLGHFGFAKPASEGPESARYRVREAILHSNLLLNTYSTTDDQRTIVDNCLSNPSGYLLELFNELLTDVGANAAESLQATKAIYYALFPADKWSTFRGVCNQFWSNLIMTNRELEQGEMQDLQRLFAQLFDSSRPDGFAYARERAFLNKPTKRHTLEELLKVWKYSGTDSQTLEDAFVALEKNSNITVAELWLEETHSIVWQMIRSGVERSRSSDAPGTMALIRLPDNQRATKFVIVVRAARDRIDHSRTFAVIPDFGSEARFSYKAVGPYFYALLQPHKCQSCECTTWRATTGEDSLYPCGNATCKHIHLEVTEYTQLQGLSCLLVLVNRVRVTPTFLVSSSYSF